MANYEQPIPRIIYNREVRVNDDRDFKEKEEKQYPPTRQPTPMLKQQKVIIRSEIAKRSPPTLKKLCQCKTVTDNCLFTIAAYCVARNINPETFHHTQLEPGYFDVLYQTVMCIGCGKPRNFAPEMYVMSTGVCTLRISCVDGGDAIAVQNGKTTPAKLGLKFSRVVNCNPKEPEKPYSIHREEILFTMKKLPLYIEVADPISKVLAVRSKFKRTDLNKITGSIDTVESQLTTAIASVTIDDKYPVNSHGKLDNSHPRIDATKDRKLDSRHVANGRGERIVSDRKRDRDYDSDRDGHKRNKETPNSRPTSYLLERETQKEIRGRSRTSFEDYCDSYTPDRRSRKHSPERSRSRDTRPHRREDKSYIRGLEYLKSNLYFRSQTGSKTDDERDTSTAIRRGRSMSPKRRGDSQSRSRSISPLDAEEYPHPILIEMPLSPIANKERMVMDSEVSESEGVRHIINEDDESCDIDVDGLTITEPKTAQKLLTDTPNGLPSIVENPPSIPEPPADISSTIPIHHSFGGNNEIPLEPTLVPKEKEPMLQTDEDEGAESETILDEGEREEEGEDEGEGKNEGDEEGGEEDTPAVPDDDNEDMNTTTSPSDLIDFGFEDD